MLSIQRETLPRLEEQVTLGGKEVEGVPGVGTQGELGGGGTMGKPGRSCGNRAGKASETFPEQKGTVWWLRGDVASHRAQRLPRCVALFDGTRTQPLSLGPVLEKGAPQAGMPVQLSPGKRDPQLPY